MLARMPDTRPQPVPGDDAVPEMSRHAYVLAVLVFVGSLILVAMYARYAGEREQELAEARLVSDASQAVALLRRKMQVYELTARGGVSLFATVERPTALQWRNYVDGLDLPRRFPEMLGLGFADSLSPGELESLQREMRDAGQGWFTVRPHGVRERYGPILYLEPQTQANRNAIGYDMFSERARRQAMAAARDTGEMRMTEGVHLVQDATRPDALGILVYAPIYRSGARPSSIDARRESFVGWAYTLFRMHVFVAETLREMPARISIRITDVTGGQEQLLYPLPGDGVAFDAGGDAPRHTLFAEFHGRKWRIDVQPPPAGAYAAPSAGLRATLSIGLLASLLLFAVALSLARTQSQARRLAMRMSESHRRSEQRFRSAMRYSAIGKALLDREGRIQEANPALVELLGTTEEELQGTLLGQHFVDGEIDAVRTVERQSLAEDGAYRVTRRLRRRDGEVRHASLVFAAVPGEHGESFASLVQVEDVTERMRSEARVQALNRTLEARVALRTRELSHANQELEAFAYSVSHDLRAPLRSIDGFSRLLNERYRDVIDPSGLDYLQRIRNASARMSELIDALLKMSRVSRAELKFMHVDLSAMAGEIAADLRNADPERKVAFDIEPGLDVSGDPALLRNLMENLLGNAWKFTAGTADARIEVGRNAQGEVFVRDNGAGFDPAYAAKLFRPFQRLHSQEQYAGHGIGLASVRRIVERHGGSVRAEGRAGLGATFLFRLPVEPLEH
jgi:PAS domain S-box-containing protein